MKNLEFLIAWANGEHVQYKDPKGEWLDLAPPVSCFCSPNFYDSAEFRIKPKTVKVAVFEFPSDGSLHFLQDGHLAFGFEQISDWVEIELKT